MEVLLVLLYFLVGVISAGLLIRFTLLDEDDVVIWVIVVAWPLVLASALAVFVLYYVDTSIKYIGGKK